MKTERTVSVSKEKRWKKIIEIMKKTKDLDVDSILIVPKEKWNPSILSKKRTELLIVIENKKPKSETELAKLVKRKRENVVSDLRVLEHYGLVNIKREGKKRVPYLKKTEIMIV